MKLAPLVAVCLTMAAHTIMAIPIPPQDGTNVTLSARAENVTKRGEGPICVGKDEDCPIGTEKYWSLINCRVWDVITDHHWKGKTYYCEGRPVDKDWRQNEQ